MPERAKHLAGIGVDSNKGALFGLKLDHKLHLLRLLKQARAVSGPAVGEPAALDLVITAVEKRQQPCQAPRLHLKVGDIGGMVEAESFGCEML